MLGPTLRQWLTGLRVEVANAKVLLFSQCLQPACAQGGLGEEGAGAHCVKDAKQTWLGIRTLPLISCNYVSVP